MDALLLLLGAGLGLGFIVAMIIAGIGLVALRAWVLTWLWQWFVVPHFDADPLPIPIAFGLCFIAGLLITPHAHTPSDEHKKAKWEHLVGRLLGPLVLLGTGWVVKTLFL